MDRRLPARHIVLALIALAALAVSAPREGAAADTDRVVRSTPIGTGDLAPDFTLLDQDGEPHTLSAEWTDKQAVVLIFYRGYW